MRHDDHTVVTADVAIAVARPTGFAEDQVDTLATASMCLRNETLPVPSDTAGSPWLAAAPVVCRGRLQQTPEDGQRTTAVTAVT
jgi:hypothetical protein